MMKQPALAHLIPGFIELHWPAPTSARCRLYAEELCPKHRIHCHISLVEKAEILHLSMRCPPVASYRNSYLLDDADEANILFYPDPIPANPSSELRIPRILVLDTQQPNNLHANAYHDFDSSRDPSKHRNRGGVIGCTTAYFLTRHPSFNSAIHKITLLEAESIASGASGKAGGLLGLWAYPSCIVPLSYRLHAELAKEHDGAKRWGYRALHCGSVTARGKVHKSSQIEGDVSKEGTEEWKKLCKTKSNGKKVVPAEIPKDLDWLDNDTLRGYSEMGTPETTAQVHPYLFTNAVAELAVEKGAEIILGSVTALDYKGVNGAQSVTYEDKITKEIHTIPATDIVVAAGPWTSTIFPEAPIEALRAHSIVIKADVSPYAVFTEIELPRNYAAIRDGEAKKRRHAKFVNPEMYARPDGTVYACGEGDNLIPLPPSSAHVQCDDTRCDDMYSYLCLISSPFRNGSVVAKQACYLPLVSSIGDRGPIIGKTPWRGLFVAAGHTCWGIQNSCATGKVMSEFVFEGECRSADVSELDPGLVLGGGGA
ncbi:hypothetical protein HYALB_00010526 [Hymenoscyphus albidus]|uniref:FAD dependent oxidoreductase domain-containing protein n=1 Tax=Hymenoscyphus albidus TaxID=595503 RepID=A0A9N9LU92_9HELO|nr:hypothetical protein HYALB_00010526 [Hymenoscyphus albidus]